MFNMLQAQKYAVRRRTVRNLFGARLWERMRNLLAPSPFLRIRQLHSVCIGRR